MVRADPSRDYYGDLELPPTADINDIKKQFKKLALKYHPDRNIGRENEVNAKFQAIQSAHEVLTDPEQRAKYDASRKRGMAYASGFGASAPTPRGNPYANAGSQWAPPPKRNPNPNRPPPPSAGAQRYKNFETPGAGASAHKTAQEGAESRRSTYQAWENMRGKPESAKAAYGSRAETGPGKSWATPKAPSKEYTPQSGREESNNMKHSVPPRSKAYDEFMTGSMPRRSQSTKRAGFMPSDPTGDEPQAGSKSAYFTSSNRRAEFPNDVPPPPPRPHVVDPLKQFREQAGAPSEPRLSTPYSTHGGEKTNPFESANINRSRSTMDPGSAGAFSPTSSSDRHRSASPPRSRAHRSHPTNDYVPRTDSDPNMARRNNPYAPRHTPVVDLDSTSSEDEARRPAASHQKPREYAKPKKRTTATPKPPPTGTENSKHIPLREFREWWKANQKSHTATDPSLKEFPQGQTTHNASGQPSMYAYSFTVNAPEIKPAVKLPKVSEAHSSKDGYLARDEDPYGLTSRSLFTKWRVPPKDDTDHLGGSDATTPSGASTHALNPFEMKQRNLLDQLVNNPRKGERLCPFTSKISSSGMASQPAPPQASQNSQHSFSFDTDGSSENPPMTSFPSSSAENISTKFTPEDWDGKFKAGDYFMNEQKAANMPTAGRARSGSRTRGKSPIKPRAGSRPNLSTKAPVPGLDPKPDSEVPLESPGGTRQFSAQEWEQTFAPAVFAPPPHQSPSGRSAYPNRKGSKTQRGSVPRPTAGTAAVIDDSDSSDGKPLFMGRNKLNGNSTSSGTSTQPETRTASPTPMDIDTEEPPRTPSAPRMASSTLRKQGLAAFAKAAAEGQPRNVPLEPSRPEWRDTNGRAEASNGPQPDLPPRATKSPSKRRAAESAGSDGFESINLETLKNAEPIMQGAKGLNGFDDLASNLPFQSQAASKVPIAKSSTTGDLDLPTIPRAPNSVNASQPASWQAYLSAFSTYMVDWDLFSCRMISHFTARRHQVQQMRQGWLGGVADEPCLQYMEGLTEDMKVHDWWCTAMEMHKQNVKNFMAMREAAKHHFGVA